MGTHEGREVIGIAVSVRKAGDGLSEAVKTDPVTLQVGDEGIIAFEFKVVGVNIKAEDRRDPAYGGVTRVHVLDAGTATFLDDAIVHDALARQADKNRRRQEQEEGVSRLDDKLLMEAHERGDHADGLVEFCPFCDAERDAAEAEGGAEGAE